MKNYLFIRHPLESTFSKKLDKLLNASQGLIKSKSKPCNRHKYTTFKLIFDHFLKNWYSLDGGFKAKSCVEIRFGYITSIHEEIWARNCTVNDNPPKMVCKGLITDPDETASDEATNEYNIESLAGKCGATIFHCFSPSTGSPKTNPIKVRAIFAVMCHYYSKCFMCFQLIINISFTWDLVTSMKISCLFTIWNQR